MYLPSLILILAASGVIQVPGNMSTHSMISPNSIRESKDFTEPTPFYEALAKALKKRKIKIENICPPSDPVSRRILEEYGAIFVADKKVTPPPVCVFTNEDQVTRFQDAAGFDAEVIGFDEIELQPEALKKLNKARAEAQKEGLAAMAAKYREGGDLYMPVDGITGGQTKP